MEEPCVIDRVIIDKQHQKEIEESSTKIELLTQMNGAGISKQMKTFHDQIQNLKDQLLFAKNRNEQDKLATEKDFEVEKEDS